MKKAKIRNRHNQVPHLTQDIEWESDKITRKRHIQESPEVSPFPAGDHKATRNRQNKTPRTKATKKIHKRRPALERSVRKLLAGLNQFYGANLTRNSDVDKDTVGTLTPEKEMSIAHKR